ncbi:MULTISPECIES: LLM class flavin-dependent oxidoreductase [unclassified Nocardioides]|uniref:LLM class flavin-dependent oxidoreductase n=1 Tax=unclassified Nocardioides TaxID=2615069 RepID=UPI0009F12AF0|nr:MULTISPECIES: LLM class flavin-dependent oxidoreductase [unclassified Nocardioides]GAW51000.1 luciferase-like monooxygenase [Nocardioides sp. PD653-B2]GAW56272.1 luciferase-like monooxygenase [Nocardioides sp. PD653]
MRVGLLQEGDLTGTTVADRYHQLIDEVALADSLGFSTWGTSEQHFTPPSFSVAAPEVLYSAIAMRTKNIKLRTMASVMLKWNHPILVAERLATLDIVSRGRAEVCTARSNNLTSLRAFGVDPAETRDQWEDGMDVLMKAMVDEKLEHDGPIWKIPPVEVVPKPFTKPHPAVSVAASSVESHGNAGTRGIGAITFDNYFGFDYLQECLDAYRIAFDAADLSNVAAPNDYRGVYVATAYCAADRDEARRIAHDIAMDYFKFILDLYIPLSQKPGYTYLDTLDKLIEHQDDLNWLCEYTPSVMIGTPEDFIERIHRLEAMGVDEVLLRIDGFGHENIKRSLELIGREVIPVVDPTAATR